MSSFRSLGQRGSPCRLVFRSDACEDENCVVPLKGISEKRKRILQRDITVRDRRRIALAYISGYRGYTMRAHEWGWWAIGTLKGYHWCRDHSAITDKTDLPNRWNGIEKEEERWLESNSDGWDGTWASLAATLEAKDCWIATLIVHDHTYPNPILNNEMKWEGGRNGFGVALSGEVGDVVADDYLCFVLCRCVHHSLCLCLVELTILVCVKTMRRGAPLFFSCYCLYPGARDNVLFLNDGFGLFWSLWRISFF